MASKFWEHFLYIAHAMNNLGDDGVALWDEEDGFFYDVLHLPNGDQFPLKSALDGRTDPALRRRNARTRSCSTSCPASSGASSGSSRIGRISPSNVACMRTPGNGRAAAAVDRRRERLRRVLRSCWTRTSSSRRTASARCRAITRTTLRA